MDKKENFFNLVAYFFKCNTSKGEFMKIANNIAVMWCGGP